MTMYTLGLICCETQSTHALTGKIWVKRVVSVFISVENMSLLNQVSNLVFYAQSTTKLLTWFSNDIFLSLRNIDATRATKPKVRNT